jgi:hypothetical protein
MVSIDPRYEWRGLTHTVSVTLVVNNGFLDRCYAHEADDRPWTRHISRRSLPRRIGAASAAPPSPRWPRHACERRCGTSGGSLP